MMGRPAVKELSLILFRPIDFKSDKTAFLLGKGICWMQYGLGCKSSEICHIGVAMRHPITGELMIYEENWPRPRWRSLDDPSIDWEQVVVMEYTGPEIPEVARQAARVWCESQVKKQTYGIPSIEGFAAESLTARVASWFGFWGPMRSLLKHRQTEANKLDTPLKEVCSQIVDKLYLSQLGIDILPNIAPGQACPGDFSQVVPFTQVWGHFGK